jgi:hypothetical protein
MRRVMIPFAVGFAALLGVLALGAPGAFAQSPWWHVSSNSRPSTLQPGGEGTILLQVLNVGNGTTSGPITVTDKLPEGVTVQRVEVKPGEPEPKVSFKLNASNMGAEEEGRFFGSGLGPQEELGSFHACSEPSPREIKCIYEEYRQGSQADLGPYEDLELGIAVKVEAGSVSSGESSAEVSGGTAPVASLKQPLHIGETPAAFGIEYFSMVPEAEGGTVDAQAGSHPFQLTVSLATNQNADPLTPPALTKDLRFNLPTGFVGNPTPLPQCSEKDFVTLRGGLADLCRTDTAIGVATFSFDEPKYGGEQTVSVPLFNLVPARGEPARFGFEFVGVPVEIKTSVRTGSDYGVTASVSNITQLANFQSETVTFWGVPEASSHDSARGWGCFYARFGQASLGSCSHSETPNPPPFLTLPTSCAKPWLATLEGDSWPTKADPGGLPIPATPYSLADDSGRAVGIDGCNQLPFRSSIEASPDVQEGSSPSGLKVDVHVPQEVSENPLGLASSSVKDIAVTLPEGVALNPAGGGGLEACSNSQVGYLPGESSPPDELHFTASLVQPFCPDASKIGTVKIKTPLLPNPLEGAVYLATQEENPFGSLIAMYIVAEDPIDGVLVKLPGEVSLNQQTGQITTTFKDNPELPFEDAELHFFGGERAPLGTPAHCGVYTTQASFVPWSGNEAVASTSSFEVKTGPNGAPCPGAALPFSPSLTAGTTSIQAGGLSPFTMTMSREDGQQSLQAISLHMPPGLSGLLTGVELCQEPQADEGLCGSRSLIGETIVSVGLGGDPFSVKGGRVYLTGPYKGAPFGLSIVNPAKAGPFDLEKNTPCDCVVVRAKIEVDPVTAALTVTTDDAGSYGIPTVIDGIPLEIQHVNVTINRPAFTFNPTNCNPMAITGSLSSAEGGSAALSTPFQVTNCATLGFKPQFSVSTSGKTSRANGASLHVKLVYPKAPFGSQANIGSVKVDLPKRLPSRLTTLQKACVDSVFAANPAACPAASKIGTATATTPLLPVSLSGPAYFVSHGGAKFPELIIVLQGYGVTVDLHSETFINQAGITSSTFRAIPDVPVGTFELSLPQGPYSALAANGNLCGATKTVLVKRRLTVKVDGHKKKVTRRVKETAPASLEMPTAFTAQNGAVIHQNTPIGVTGCGKAKPKSKGKAGGHAKAGKK